MKRMRMVVIGSLVTATLVGCASSPSVESTATDLADTLIGQMEQRVDLRTARIYVARFLPCDAEGEEIVEVRDPGMARRHEATAGFLRHQLMGDLAPRTNVVDDTGVDISRGVAKGSAAYERAESLDANLVLFGNFAMEGDELLVMLRVVDVSERTILVATQGLVPHLQGGPAMQNMAMSSRYRTQRRSLLTSK